MILFKTKSITKNKIFLNLILKKSVITYNEIQKNFFLFKIFYLKTKKILKANIKNSLLTNIANSQKNSTVVYNFVINSSGSNVFINIYDLKLKKNLKTVTLGSYKIKKKTDKITKKYFLMQLLNNSFLRLKKLEPISINFIGLNLMYNKFITNVLKKNFIVQSIKFYNLNPHNGCRPRKKLRK